MKKSNNKKGFTLVELVIVVAVIAILSAILIPTIGTVIRDAKDAAVKSDIQSYITSEIANAQDDIPEQYVLKVEDGKIVAVYEIKDSNYKMVTVDDNGVALKMGNTTITTVVKLNEEVSEADVVINEVTYKWTAYGTNGLYVLVATTSGAAGQQTV